MQFKGWITAGVWIGLAGPAFAARVTVDSGSVAPGGSMQLNVRYEAQGAQAAGLQFDLEYNSPALTLSTAEGQAVKDAGKSLSTSDPAAGRKRFIIAGLNQNIIGDGVLVILTVQAASAASGTYTLALTALSASDKNGQAISTTGVNGSVAVDAPGSCTPPSIVAPPGSQTIDYGATATLTTTATGTAPLSYQWWQWGPGNTSAVIAGATSQTYQTPPLTANTAYFVRVRNACGTAQSAPGTVTVRAPTCTGPAITVQPASQTIDSGQRATLTVTATGTAPLSFEWWRWGPGDTSVRVSTSASPDFQTPPLASNTAYFVRVRNACGSVQSNIANVTVRAAPPAFQTRLYFPGVADGGGFDATVMLYAPDSSTTIAGKLSFFDHDGRPRTVKIGATIASEFPAFLSGGAPVFVKTSNTGAGIQPGWALLESQTPVSGTVLIELRNALGFLCSMAGVSGMTPARRFAFPVQAADETALGIVNPNSGAVTVQLVLLDEHGGRRVVIPNTLASIPALGYRAGVLSDWLGDSTFSGALIVECSTAADLVATGLVMKEGLLAALPIVSLK